MSDMPSGRVTIASTTTPSSEPIARSGKQPAAMLLPADLNLRDWFAGQALIGIVVKGYQPAYAGQLAYEFADDMLDAMLKAREDGQ